MYACFTRQPILKNNLELASFSLRFSDGVPCPSTLAFFKQVASNGNLLGNKQLLVDFKQYQHLTVETFNGQLPTEFIYEFSAKDVEIAANLLSEQETKIHMAFRGLPYLDHNVLSSTCYIFYPTSHHLNAIQNQAISLSPYRLLHIADNVENSSDFSSLQQSKFPLLDGYRGQFFMQAPLKQRRRTLNPATRTLSTIIQLASNELSFSEIEDILKQDIALTYKLLRYVNSPAFGMRRPIVHIRDALQILGLNNLFRWLSVQMLSSASGPGTLAMMEISLIRARFLDLLSETYLGKNHSDSLYLLGAFSALNHILGISFDDIFEEIPMNSEIIEALKNEQGQYGRLLQLAKALEHREGTEAIALAGHLKIPIEVINQAHLSALTWLAYANQAISLSNS